MFQYLAKTLGPHRTWQWYSITSYPWWSPQNLFLSLSLPFIYVFAYPTDRPTDRVALHILAYLVLILPFEKCILTCFLRFANDEVDGHSPSLLRSRSKASRHSRAQKVAEDAAMDCGLEDECSPGKATATGGWGGRADTVDGFRKYPIVNRVSYIHVGWCRISSINSRTETTHGTDWVKFHDVKTSIGVQEVYSVCLQFWIAHRLIKVSYTHIYYSEDFVYHTSTKVCWHIVESSQKPKMCADQQFTTNIYQFAGHTAPILAAHALSFSAVHRWLECFENAYPSLAQAIYSDPSWPYLNFLSSTNCRRGQSVLKEALPE